MTASHVLCKLSPYGIILISCRISYSSKSQILKHLKIFDMLLMAAISSHSKTWWGNLE